MYATLRYSQRKDTPIRLERQQVATASNSGKGHQHVACHGCRAKKVRCTGQKAGCDRCKSKSLPCVYGKDTERKRSSSSSFGGSGSGASSPLAGSTSSSDRMVMEYAAAGLPPLMPEPPGMHEFGLTDVNMALLADQTMAARPMGMGMGMGWTGQYGEQQVTDLPVLQADPSRSLLSYTSDEIGVDWQQWLSGTDLRPTSNPETMAYEAGRASLGLITPDSQSQSQSPYLSTPSSGSPAPSSVDLSTFVSGGGDMPAMCRCISEMLKMLGRLEQTDRTLRCLAHWDHPLIRATLAFQRHTLDRCGATLGCPSCRPSSQQLVLIGLVVEKLVAQYEMLQSLVVKEYQRRRRETVVRPRAPGQALAPGQGSSGAGKSARGQDKDWMGGWPIGEHAYQSAPAGAQALASHPSFPKDLLLEFLLPLPLPEQDEVLADRHSRRLADLVDRAKFWARAMHRTGALAMFLRLEKRVQEVVLRRS